MRDLIVFGTVILLLPTAFRKPFIGLLLFSWLAYMRPQDLCWGYARAMRFSFSRSTAPNFVKSGRGGGAKGPTVKIPPVPDAIAGTEGPANRCLTNAFTSSRVIRPPRPEP